MAVPAVLTKYAFYIACVYGVAWTIVFARMGERHPGYLHAIYAMGFVVLLFLIGVDWFAGGIVGLIVVILQGFIVLAFNAGALLDTAEYCVTRVGRWVLGLDQMVFRRTYDRASGAEARGEFALAADLYRQELAQHPEDLEARRRLAEALVQAGRPEEAVAEFRCVMDGAKSSEQRHSAAFRLAELLGESLGRPGEAEQLYRLVIREDPQGKLAQYARARLSRGGPDEEPTDF